MNIQAEYLVHRITQQLNKSPFSCLYTGRCGVQKWNMSTLNNMAVTVLATHTCEDNFPALQL